MFDKGNRFFLKNTTVLRRVYLDNAATTTIAGEVIAEMVQTMQTVCGNPSSSHQYGRTAKTIVENARKSIAKHLNVAASELIFTSGGTEANNLILRNAVVNLGVTHVVTSKIEHAAVLNPLKELATDYGIQISYVDMDSKGLLDYAHLRSLLSNTGHKTLVSLMAVNNEIGSLLSLQKTANICHEYKALFHSDAVQAIGHFNMDLQRACVDFITASAHKFHGPKGIGFAYFKKGVGIKPLLYGGSQEKGARAGTEAVHLIRGMQVALDISLKGLTTEIQKMQARKSFFIQELKTLSPSIAFNGCSSDVQASSATILNVRLPLDSPFLLFQLDLKGIAVSGGSACQSGSNGGSHVLRTLLTADEAQKTSLRFSFSKHTTNEELLYVVDVLKELIFKEVSN